MATARNASIYRGTYSDHHEMREPQTGQTTSVRSIYVRSTLTQAVALEKETDSIAQEATLIATELSDLLEAYNILVTRTQIKSPPSEAKHRLPKNLKNSPNFSPHSSTPPLRELHLSKDKYTKNFLINLGQRLHLNLLPEELLFTEEDWTQMIQRLQQLIRQKQQELETKEQQVANIEQMAKSIF